MEKEFPSTFTENIHLKLNIKFWINSPEQIMYLLFLYIHQIQQHFHLCGSNVSVMQSLHIIKLTISLHHWVWWWQSSKRSSARPERNEHFIRYVQLGRHNPRISCPLHLILSDDEKQNISLKRSFLIQSKNWKKYFSYANVKVIFMDASVMDLLWMTLWMQC